MNLPDGSEVIIEPRFDSKTYQQYEWPVPQLATVIAGEIAIPNDCSGPVVLHKNEHICQVRSTTELTPFDTSTITPPTTITIPNAPHSSDIEFDAKLSGDHKQMFIELHTEFDDVFKPIIGRYNDFSGRVRGRVNVGDTKPPARKLHCPNYSKGNQDLLQDKFDELEKQGVFVRPEDANITVDHVSPSFLVRKANGQGHRLVTAFTTIGQYTKTLPTTMPTMNDTLRSIASWKYIIKTDLRDSFYQIPLEKSSMKWCGTQTPYRGLRIYAVTAQGMPGSSETLEEMMCTVLGSMVRSGFVAKLADDLYVGSHISIEDLHQKWEQVLVAMRQNGLKLKAAKTYIAPTKCQILGWNWNCGNISASSHKITPLATCEPPKTATAMRSFIGAYKVFNRVIRGCSNYLSHLESAIAEKQKSEKIVWTDVLTDSFHKAQEGLKSNSSIMIPKRSDQLIITHDGSQIGIGSVLFVQRNGSLHLGGFFSAKLKSHHRRWLPCELEALSIATSVQHFAHYIRESDHATQVLTDSKPCVQAWTKMCRGEFSTSARIATFLSSLSEHNMELHCISGKMNLPSDFHSRNPQECDAKSSCQICKFVDDNDDASVRAVTAEEILSGHADMPYSNRNAWKALQLECSDLRRVHAHLSKGTKPSMRATNQTSVKRYLNEVIISRDGLLVAIHTEPYFPRKELIVIPQHLVCGILTSLHLSLNHPSTYQLQKVFSRSFFALKLQKCVALVANNCHTCQSLKSVPRELHVQSSSDFPVTPCKSFGVDIVKRYNQKIFVMRDTFSSFTTACIITDETSTTMKEALISSISTIRPTPQTPVKVRVDNAPGFKGMKNDNDLTKLMITLDYGRVHNKNKNPVVDKGIQELISEILRICPDGGKVTPIVLSYAINQLNSRIRDRGLSAWEILHQRDQHTYEEISIPDKFLSTSQEETRSKNQHYGAIAKARGAPEATPYIVTPGCLVYIKQDGGKSRARERYLVTETNKNTCTIQKLAKSLRNVKYEVKLTEVFPVTPTINIHDNCLNGMETEEEETPATIYDNYDDEDVPPQRQPQLQRQSQFQEADDNVYTLPVVTDDPITTNDDDYGPLPEVITPPETIVEHDDDHDATRPTNGNLPQEDESPSDGETNMMRRQPSKRQRRVPQRFNDYHLN